MTLQSAQGYNGGKIKLEVILRSCVTRNSIGDWVEEGAEDLTCNNGTFVIDEGTARGVLLGNAGECGSSHLWTRGRSCLQVCWAVWSSGCRTSTQGRLDLPSIFLNHYSFIFAACNLACSRSGSSKPTREADKGKREWCYCRAEVEGQFATNWAVRQTDGSSYSRQSRGRWSRRLGQGDSTPCKGAAACRVKGGVLDSLKVAKITRVVTTDSRVERVWASNQFLS